MATTLLAACAPLDAADSGPSARGSAAPEAVTSSSHAAVADPITFRGSSVSALDQPAGAASIAVARPSGTVAGDVEIAVVATQSGITVTPPDGFRLVTSQVDTGSAVAGQGWTPAAPSPARASRRASSCASPARTSPRRTASA
ncbi:hypothetical protein BE08_27260 [Sorangium cellulosum]|uniref:Uncharacterized protein n=1 Tax=Sorangium cellulosum TaxID=56 RepID=A0A150PCY9_SORCE|nr:hypothetical protein BE08_27260 [Sorangium cellulosum]